MLGSIRVPRILIVEDNDAFAATLSAALRVLDDVEVRAVRPDCAPAEVLGVALEWRADVVVLDVDLHQWWSGATLCEPLANCGTPVIVATAAPELVPAGCPAEVYDKSDPWGDLMRLIDRAAHKPIAR